MDHKSNKDLSQIFKDLSVIYKYLGGNDRFRALAYEKAAKVLDSLQEDIVIFRNHHSVDELPGIGEGLSQKIDEFIQTGKIEKYENLKKTVPHELLHLMEITGFGPQSLKQIHNELKINTQQGLIEALRNGSVTKLKGFGNKKIENMLRALKLHKIIEDRMLLWDALKLGEQIIEWVKKIPGVSETEFAGSLRRKKETIGDFDILISCEEKNRKKVTDALISSEQVNRVLVKGNTKISILLKESGKQVDFRVVNIEEWGSALQYFTGSKEHNIHLRSIAKEKGYKISEYGIFNLHTNKKIGGRTEEEIYKTLGFQIMPPEMRENLGEIELSSQHKIPTLIEQKDLKGDFQMHSLWSDGINSIDQIVQYVKNKYPYDFIVITDHSKSLRVANGIDETRVSEQLQQIRDINQKMGEDFIKAGIEVEILDNGNLDFSDEILSQFDWVIASIHSNFKGDNTNRIIRACENPYVNCIGHPTGRLIGTREPYILEIERVMETARKTGTALEINAQPQRMDLNDELAMLARKKGVKLVISTDSHSLNDFEFMQLGVSIARRSWCTKEDVINTQSWKEIEKHTRLKRKTLFKIPEKEVM